MGQVRYAERSSRRAWGILLGLCLVSWLGLAFLTHGGWMLATLLVGMLGGIAALTLWSVDHYGQVLLTGSHLRVGRERIPVSDIIPASLEPRGHGVDPRGEIAGGAFDTTMGTDTIRFVRRDGRPVQVASRRPDELHRALESVLAGRL